VNDDIYHSGRKLTAYLKKLKAENTGRG
jgi:hypothetical protein